MVLLAVIASTLVVMGYLVTIWWLDRYEREPVWLIILAFIWGGLGGTCLAVGLSTGPQAGLIALFGNDIGVVLTTIGVAPIVEEFTKGLIFLPLLFSRQIDTETDGLMYGAAVGLGFAAMENLLYYAGAGDAIFQTIVVRTLFTSIVHCIASSLVGIGVGWAMHRRFSAIWAVLVGYVCAVFVHGTWNGLAVLAERSGQGIVFIISCGLLTAAGAMMFGLTQWMLMREHHVLRRILEREAANGVLPVEDARMIPYWTKRAKIKGPDRRQYIRLATTLAFRQHQLELAGTAANPDRTAEIDRLRMEVQRIGQA
jgi:RsiW-degrading membrane proteinase PrsW (M82 family)